MWKLNCLDSLLRVCPPLLFSARLATGSLNTFPSSEVLILTCFKWTGPLQTGVLQFNFYISKMNWMMNWKFLKHLLQIFCIHHRIHIKIEEPYPLVLLSSSGETFNILCIGIQLDVILENRIVLNLGWKSVSTSWFRVSTVLYRTVLYCARRVHWRGFTP